MESLAKSSINLLTEDSREDFENRLKKRESDLKELVDKFNKSSKLVKLILESSGNYSSTAKVSLDIKDKYLDPRYTKGEGVFIHLSDKFSSDIESMAKSMGHKVSWNNTGSVFWL